MGGQFRTRDRSRATRATVRSRTCRSALTCCAPARYGCGRRSRRRRGTRATSARSPPPRWYRSSRQSGRCRVFGNEQKVKLTTPTAPPRLSGCSARRGSDSPAALADVPASMLRGQGRDQTRRRSRDAGVLGRALAFTAAAAAAAGIEGPGRVTTSAFTCLGGAPPRYAYRRRNAIASVPLRPCPPAGGRASASGTGSDCATRRLGWSRSRSARGRAPCSSGHGAGARR